MAWTLHGGAEVGAFEAAGDGDHLLEVFAEDFVLRRELLDVGERAEGGHFAGAELKTVFSMASSEARASRRRRTRTV